MEPNKVSDRYWRSPSIWLAVLASIAILLLGIRAFIDPVAGSLGFGLPMSSSNETTFVQIYGARNAMLGALALTFVLARMLRPAALIYLFALALPLLDVWVMISRKGVGPEIVRHAVIFAGIAVVAFLLWRGGAGSSAVEEGS